MEGLMGEYHRLAVYPDVEGTLKALHGKKAILSNGSPDMLLPLVEHSGLEFDAVLSVDELKVYKPAPQVYELVVSKLNVSRERVAFISSNCWDAMGAKSFGFTVYWINRSGAPMDRLGLRPDRVLASLHEILQ
jgi:2-haloacid dehalogenase